MKDPGDTDQVAEATRTLALLNLQVDARRAELLALREEVELVQRQFSAARGAELLEANEQLVLAAMRAQTIADSARSNLGELAASAASSVTNSELTAAGQENQVRDLREANENLVLAVLSSQALEAEAQAAHRRQITFLATVAHELRNPLMPLKLAAQLLDRARLDESMLLKLQATINGQVAHMNRLIGDLLDGARVSTGKFRLVRSVIDMSGVFALAIDTCRDAMDARHQRFETDLPPGPLQMHGDAMRLVQVFSNLLDNASKYTPEGGTVQLRAVARQGVLVTTVSDNGIGIMAKVLPEIFELFVQDPQAVVVNRSGLGIGLAVVRELVEAHGGSVTASSGGKNLGSQFIVTLPLITASQG